MPPDRLFRKIKPYNRGPFYAIVAVISFALIVMVVLAMGKAPDKDKDTYIKVIGIGGGLLGILFIIVRQDKFTTYVHDNNHKQKSDLQAVMLAANGINRNSAAAVEKASEIVEKTAQVAEKTENFQEEVRKKLNGGLHHAVHEIVKEMPFPTTQEQLVEFVRSVQTASCEEVAEKAAEAAIRKLQEHSLLDRTPKP